MDATRPKTTDAIKANNITCYPEFAGFVRVDLGGICMAWRGLNNVCELIVGLEVPWGKRGLDYPAQFTLSQVVDVGERIAKRCRRGGKDYLEGSGRADGSGGWYVEVTLS